MSEPDNFILTLLREIRAEIANTKTEVAENRRETRAGFETVNKKIESLKQAMHGESVLGRYASAEFEDRIEAIEKRLDKLEKGH
jgi:polyhydroxyalkanoate synthesis regulator phasin